MKVVCCECKKFIRDKEPLWDTSESHTFCTECLEDKLGQLDELWETATEAVKARRRERECQT